MYCRYCGEQNLDEAVFCKNCGKRLKEEVKKPEVIIEKPKTEQHTYQQSTTTTSSSRISASMQTPSIHTTS